MKKQLAKLAKALPLKKQNGGNPKPLVQPPPEQYRFKPGQSGNPSGRPHDHAREAINRLAHTSPPKALCKQIGIDARVTWIEAVVFALGKAAVSGDVAAAREVLANLGLRGTAASSLLALNVEPSGTSFEFLKHSHGLSEEQLNELWAYMDALPRDGPPVIDASYFPLENEDGQQPD